MTVTSRRWPVIYSNEADRQRSRRFPSQYLLYCAARVLRIVGQAHHSESEMRHSYRSTASGGILSQDGLIGAERWLIENGWLTLDGFGLKASERSQMLPGDEAEIARELVRAMVLDAPPSWLNAVAVRGEIRPEFLPAEADTTLNDMLSAEERDALLLAAAEKYDESAQRALGESAEESVLTACRALLTERGRGDLARKVRRVSLISDSVGYDIQSPDLRGSECRLEVKCFRGRHPSFYITRNEFEVGLRLPRWYLVLCRAANDSHPNVVGWTALTPLAGKMPSDLDKSARWQSAKVRFVESELRPGLPIAD